MVADSSALLLGHTVRQRLGDIHQLPLFYPDCRPQTITFTGADETLQLRGHFPSMWMPSAVYIRIHVHFAQWRHPDVLTQVFPQRFSILEMYKYGKTVYYKNDRLIMDSIIIISISRSIIPKPIHPFSTDLSIDMGHGCMLDTIYILSLRLTVLHLKLWRLWHGGRSLNRLIKWSAFHCCCAKPPVGG